MVEAKPATLYFLGEGGIFLLLIMQLWNYGSLKKLFTRSPDPNTRAFGGFGLRLTVQSPCNSLLTLIPPRRPRAIPVAHEEQESGC